MLGSLLPSGVVVPLRRHMGSKIDQPFTENLLCVEFCAGL